MTPFRSEKNTNWEGAFRVPAWSAGRATSSRARSPTRSSRGHDWFPTLLAAAGDPDIKEQLLRAGGRRQDATRSISTAITSFPTSPASRTKSARKEFVYFNDDGELVAVRCENWKVVFCEQRTRRHAARFGPSRSTSCGRRRCSICAWTRTSAPTITSNTYYDWLFRRSFLVVPAQALVTKFLDTFKEFPPRQKAGELQRRPDHGAVGEAVRRLI